MDAFRQKSVRVLGDGASERWGRPRTDALRLKSVRALEDGASDRRGGRGTRSDRRVLWGARKSHQSVKTYLRPLSLRVSIPVGAFS
jgi:hypothetical protein